jgi:hypothetical protein
MQTRQRLARELGFSSYVDLVLFAEDLELASVRDLLERYLEHNLPTARALVQTNGLSWPTWFSDLDSIGHMDEDLDPSATVAQFLERIGLGQCREAIFIVEREQAIAGYPGILSVPDDIRILVNPVRTLGGWQCFLHELGHAIAHASNLENGVFKTWTSVHDETMATVIEHVAVHVLLDQANQEASQAMFVLEDTRCAISALFEFALWDHPEAAETLYVQHYSQLGLDITSPEIWAVDSFRSIDPVYIHNYVIGALVADRTVGFLQREYGDDYPRWGEWLRDNYYADGRKRTLQEKTASIGGIVEARSEPLSEPV